MNYSKILEDIHNKCLKYRRLLRFLDSEEFRDYWNQNPEKHGRLIDLINDLKIKELRNIVLKSDTIEYMTMQELRDLASKWRMKYYTKLDAETLRAELIRIRDHE